MAQRELERRRQEDIIRRDRRLAERRNLRRHYRDDFARYHRPIYRPPVDWRSPARWQRRYERWWRYYHPPVAPMPPIWIIDIPYEYPPSNDYWDRYDIAELADAMEALSVELYQMTADELQEPTQWNQETLSLMYDVVVAAQVYSDTVDASTDVYRDSLYALFNLEDAMSAVSGRILCGDISLRIQENFSQMRYYVDELLWQYRLDPSYGTDTATFSLNTLNMSSSQADTSGYEPMDGLQETVFGTLACTSGSFRWPKPHDTMEWAVEERNSQLQAGSIVIQAVDTEGRRGKNGVAGIEELTVTYTDGSRTNLIQVATDLRDSHVYGAGKLRLEDDFDQLVLPLDSTRAVATVRVTADSWIAADTPVTLSVSLTQEESGVSLMPLQ